MVRRKCPACNVPMHQCELEEGYIIDQCPTCLGTWYDAGELERCKDRHDWVRCLDIQDLLPKLRSVPSRRKCPCCTDQQMDCVLFDPAPAIDHCPRCRGFWLDPGELGAIVNALDEYANHLELREVLSLWKEEASELARMGLQREQVLDALAASHLLALRIGIELSLRQAALPAPWMLEREDLKHHLAMTITVLARSVRDAV